MSIFSMRGFLTFFISFFVVISVYGVGTDGTIVGTVTDSKGGVVSHAKVTVKNTGTNATREIFTNSSGEYNAPLLPPGAYEISVEQTGFRRAVISGIKLEVDQIARVDVVLQVGSLAEQIIISEVEPLVQTDSSTVGQVSCR